MLPAQQGKLSEAVSARKPIMPSPADSARRSTIRSAKARHILSQFQAALCESQYEDTDTTVVGLTKLFQPACKPMPKVLCRPYVFESAIMLKEAWQSVQVYVHDQPGAL